MNNPGKVVLVLQCTLLPGGMMSKFFDNAVQQWGALILFSEKCMRSFS